MLGLRDQHNVVRENETHIRIRLEYEKLKDLEKLRDLDGHISRLEIQSKVPYLPCVQRLFWATYPLAIVHVG